MKISIQSVLTAWLTAWMLAACGGGGGNGDGGGGPALVVDANGVSTFDSTALGSALAVLPAEAINPAEQESLSLMREEEKLAQDVYAQLHAAWGSQSRVFGNITQSEATHTEAVRQLLLRYNLPDPAAALAAGSYQNTKLQSLYTQLVVSGRTSLVDGLKAGTAIEEIDLLDLQKSLLVIDNQDIMLVYQNLQKGSRNHLRAFVNALAAQGVTYAAQYLTAADYQAIISTPMER